MKNKTLFSVQLPAANKSFDLWIPDELNIGDITQLTICLLEEQEGRQFAADGTTALYHKSNGVELDINKCLGEYAFADGTQLVLM